MASSPYSKTDAHGHEKVECLECGRFYHRLDAHLAAKHEMSVADYQKKHDGAATISERARKAASSAQKKRGSADEVKVVSVPCVVPDVKFDESKPFKVGSVELFMRSELSAYDLQFVPIFDEDWVVGDREKDQFELLAAAIAADENALLVGPTGVGKSTGVEQLACAVNQPIRKVNLHGDIRAADFVGEKIVDVDPQGGEQVVVWRDGILPEAMRRGHWLLLDELDGAPPHVLFVLQAVLEPARKLVLTGNHGEVVKAHPAFRFIATANTIGKGDDTGLYTGTNILNEAFLDRFGMTITVGYPIPSVEKAILVKKTEIDSETAAKMVKIAGQVREAGDKEEVYCTLSPRRLIVWARFSKTLGVKRAATVTVLNKLGKDDRAVVAELIQRTFAFDIS